VGKTHYDQVACRDLRAAGQHHVLVTETLLAPVAKAVNLHAAIAGSASVAVVVTTAFTAPDFPRNIQLVVGGVAADVPAGVVTITGTNIADEQITEDFTLTINTANTITGNKAFKTITQIDIPQCDGAGVTFTPQTGDKLGLGSKLDSPLLQSLVDATSDGSFAADAGTLAASVSAFESNTYLPADIADGTSDYRVVYVTEVMSEW